MSAKRIRGMRDLQVGKWVNLESPIRFAFAGPVGKIIKLGGATAFVTVYRGRGEATECIPPKRLTFSCDTREEAQLLFNKSLEFAKRALDHETKLRARIDRASLKKVEALLNSFQAPASES